MLRGEFFSTAKNLIMARLNIKSSISTDNEVELWIAVALGSVYIRWKGDITGLRGTNFIQFSIL
jgi:hypothetical protein